MFLRTTSTNKILRLKKRVRIIQGGTSAAKTYGILAVLIARASCVPGLEISVVAETIPHLRRGALKDFLKIIEYFIENLKNKRGLPLILNFILYFIKNSAVKNEISKSIEANKEKIFNILIFQQRLFGILLVAEPLRYNLLDLQ